MSRIFTKFAAAALLVMGLASASYAQDAVPEKDIIRPITKSGSAAFLFTIQGLGVFGLSAPGIPAGQLTSDGTTTPTTLYGAGMKYFFADNLALRIALALNNSSVKSTAASTSVTSTTTGFGVGAGVEYHFRPLYSTSPYIGGMINFGSMTNDNGQSGNAQVKSTGNQFGINILAGFDWFFTHGLAAGAEFGLGFNSVGGTVTAAGGTNSDLPSTTNIGFSSLGNVHLVVYF